MTMDSLKPTGYGPTRARMRALSLLERTAIFVLFAANALLLWHIPGVFGLILGGGMFAFVGLLVVGELWRQFQIRVLGRQASRVSVEGESQ